MTRLLNSLLNRLAFIAPGGATVRPRLQRWRGAKMGRNVWLGLYVYIDDLHPSALSIGDNCTIGIRTTILTHFYWGPPQVSNPSTVVIENNVFIGPHCVILPNVRIGEGSVIRPGTVVSQNVPPRTLWGVAQPTALAIVTVPLTAENGYGRFLGGVRPTEGRRRGESQPLTRSACSSVDALRSRE